MMRSCDDYYCRLAGCKPGDYVNIRGSRLHQIPPKSGRVIRVTPSTVVVDLGTTVAELPHREVYQ